jgi:hypothetical protein
MSHRRRPSRVDRLILIDSDPWNSFFPSSSSSPLG